MITSFSVHADTCFSLHFVIFFFFFFWGEKPKEYEFKLVGIIHLADRYFLQLFSQLIMPVKMSNVK